MSSSYSQLALAGLFTLLLGLIAFGSHVSAESPIDQTALAAYHFEEASGTQIADDAHGNHGGVSSNVGRVTGPSGRAIRINSSSTVYIPHAEQLNVGTGDFSVSLWLRTSDDSVVKRVFDKRVRSSSLYGYHMYLWKGNLGFQLADGNGEIPKCKWDNATPQCSNYTSETFLADGTWHHVVVTVDRDQRGGMQFYVDGQRVAQFDPRDRQGSLDNRADWGVPLAMDAKGAPLDVDEFLLFDHVISAETIQSLSSTQK